MVKILYLIDRQNTVRSLFLITEKRRASSIIKQ